MLSTDETFMRRALAQASAARDRDEVPVGAVLVRDGVVLTEACNEVESRQEGKAVPEDVA